MGSLDPYNVPSLVVLASTALVSLTSDPLPLRTDHVSRIRAFPDADFD
jgi:hypothetical protein